MEDEHVCPECGAENEAHYLGCREDPMNHDDPLDDDNDDDGDGF